MPGDQFFCLTEDQSEFLNGALVGRELQNAVLEVYSLIFTDFDQAKTHDVRSGIDPQDALRHKQAN